VPVAHGLSRARGLLRSASKPPKDGNAMTDSDYRPCIDACNTCAQTCEQCAHACLAEPDLKAMSRCVALNVDCAQACQIAATFMARGSDGVEAACTFCATLCELCADECAGHDLPHCQRCAQVCRHCAGECRAVAELAAVEWRSHLPAEYS
jgi:hypothetical protein